MARPEVAVTAARRRAAATRLVVCAAAAPSARSRTAVLTPDLEEIRSAIAPRAEVRVSNEIAQPGAFGLRRPVVLLAESFFAMDPQAQRAGAVRYDQGLAGLRTLVEHRPHHHARAVEATLGEQLQEIR